MGTHREARGVVAAVAVGLGVGCGASGPEVTSAWARGDACQALTLSVEVRGAKDAKVSVGAVSADAGAAGIARLVVPAASVGADGTFAVNVERAGKATPMRARAPARAPAEFKAPYVPGSTGDWQGEVTWTVAGREQPSYSAKISADDAGGIAFPLPCGVVGASGGTGKVELRDGRPFYVVDVLTPLLSRKEAEYDEPYDLEVAADGPAGEMVAVTFKGSLHASYLVFKAYTRSVGKGVAWAPVREAARQQPSLLLTSMFAPTYLFYGEKIGDAATFAMSRAESEPAGKCGPYRDPAGGGKRAYVDRFRSVTILALYEARTGTLIVEKKIRGAAGKCPESVLAVVETGRATFGQEARGEGIGYDAMEKWFKSVTR